MVVNLYSRPLRAGFIDEIGSNAIPVKSIDKINKVLAVARKAVCKVNVFQKALGTGALYEVVDRNRISHSLIMTCNHVLLNDKFTQRYHTNYIRIRGY